MMVLNKYRKQADTLLKPLALKLKFLNPDLISWLGLLFAFLAGIFFYSARSPIFVLAGGISVILNSLLDALDGKVAKLTNNQSRRGDFLDHSLDRYADIFILAGIILGPLCRTWIGFFAIVGVLMTSYMGTQADAVGVSRDYGGIAGRAERLVLLILFSMIYFLTYEAGWTSFELQETQIGLFEILMIWFAISGNITAVFRGLNTWRDLGSS